MPLEGETTYGLINTMMLPTITVMTTITQGHGSLRYGRLSASIISVANGLRISYALPLDMGQACEFRPDVNLSRIIQDGSRCAFDRPTAGTARPA
jgi:hypothetical protein